MFINPTIALEEGWISGIVNHDKQVQPNAIDYTINRAFTIKTSEFVLTETQKQMRGGKEIPVVPRNGVGEEGWVLYGHMMLDALSDMYVSLPEGVAALLVPRSTLTRNGLITANGLYDSGFQGHIGTTIHNFNNGPAFIGRGTRIGQIIFVDAAAAKSYAGGYNHGEGSALEYQK